MIEQTSHPKIFYGWYIVGACILIMLFVGGVIDFGFTAVIEPIAKEFGWSYAQISLAASLRGLEIGLLAPVMGLLVDRWGPRRLVLAGSLIICGGLLTLSRVNSLAMFYGAFALIAIGMSTCAQTVIMTAVANWFRRKAGLAIGITASGFGLGGLLVPVVTKMIDVFEWRTAIFALGLATLAVILPLSLLIRHKPEPYGYLPDGDQVNYAKTENDRVTVSTPKEISMTPWQAVKNRAFWNIAIGSMCHGFVIGAIITHVMPYLSSLGVSRVNSSLVALLLPVVSIGGRLSSGWLADRFGSRRVFAASFLAMTAGLFIYGNLTAGMLWLIIPFIIFFSLGWGCSVTSRFSLLREYFGRGRFGTILGFLSGIMMVGSISGSPLAGWIFDTFGSYKGAWFGFCAATILGAILVLTIPPSNVENRL
jgi:MFS family permease